MKYTENDLLYMLSEGSEFAFREIFNIYKDHLYRVALTYVKQGTIAEEIVQDVFLKVWLNKEKLKEIKSLKAWIYTIAKNQIVTRYKKTLQDNKKNSDYLYLLPHNGETTYSQVLDREYNRILEKGIAKLPEQQREVYHLIKELDYSYKDAAEKLKISPLTVKTHLARSMNFLRNYIKQSSELICLLLLFRIF